MQAMSFPSSSVEALTSGLSSGNVPEITQYLQPIGSCKYFYKHVCTTLYHSLMVVSKTSNIICFSLSNF